MIRDVHGDILLSKADVVAHGVAPNDDFSNGLALALRERWPAMYKDFRHYCRVSHPAEGDLWIWGGPGVRIANLFTQKAAYGHGAHPGAASHERRSAASRDRRRAAGVGRRPTADRAPSRRAVDSRLPVQRLRAESSRTGEVTGGKAREVTS